MVAEILHLFARNPAYLDLLDARRNRPASPTMHQLQQLHVLAKRVQDGHDLDAEQIRAVLVILKRAGVIDDLTAQHDAAEVFEAMLRQIDRSGSQMIEIRDTSTSKRRTAYALHVEVTSEAQTLEDALGSVVVTSLPSTLTIVLHRKTEQQPVRSPATLELLPGSFGNATYTLTGSVTANDHDVLTYRRV